MQLHTMNCLDLAGHRLCFTCRRYNSISVHLQPSCMSLCTIPTAETSLKVHISGTKRINGAAFASAMNYTNTYTVLRWLLCAVTIHCVLWRRTKQHIITSRAVVLQTGSCRAYYRWQTWNIRLKGDIKLLLLCPKNFLTFGAYYRLQHDIWR